MELSNELFLEKDEYNSSEKIINKIQKGELSDILNRLCYINVNDIIIDSIYFKYLASEQTYEYILRFISNVIDNVLTRKTEFIVHLNMKNMSLSDIYKHQTFIKNISMEFKIKYPDTLLKCYIYNAPNVFKQIFNIVSTFIDKETQKKISLVQNQL